jgi:hypothetical protein
MYMYTAKQSFNVSDAYGKNVREVQIPPKQLYYSSLHIHEVLVIQNLLPESYVLLSSDRKALYRKTMHLVSLLR